jgi:hypothetical protein
MYQKNMYQKTVSGNHFKLGILVHLKFKCNSKEQVTFVFLVIPHLTFNLFFCLKCIDVIYLKYLFILEEFEIHFEETIVKVIFASLLPLFYFYLKKSIHFKLEIFVDNLGQVSILGIIAELYPTFYVEYIKLSTT